MKLVTTISVDVVSSWLRSKRWLNFRCDILSSSKLSVSRLLMSLTSDCRVWLMILLILCNIQHTVEQTPHTCHFDSQVKLAYLAVPVFVPPLIPKVNL